MAATRPALQRVGKELYEGSSSLTVGLAGLPRTALPSDLRRLCGKSKIENVVNASIEHERFRPTGQGFLTFARPEYANAAFKALKQVVVGGKSVRARASNTLPELPRSRGTKGLLEAGQRGAITGNGPSGGVTGSGRNVVLYGLPGRMVPVMLADSLRKFKLAGSEFGREAIVKLEQQGATSTSRFLVRASSVAEAHRLVRAFHMRPWRPDLNGDKYMARAFVVW
ncbi:hypothetical protein GY45DRAFT_1322836 [Cubamyces sp. BRFM 1775]|nr:hypothetical protein GY45DRAFT_1322836 [Cubamyces sp. BRFM 1775]